MTFPAWLELIDDDEVVDHPTALRLYVRLIRSYPLIFYKPHHVKVDYWAEQLHTHRDRVSAALRLLIAKGYIVETGRTINNVREVMVALERATCPRNEAAPPAA
jgi:hypothetical protein